MTTFHNALDERELKTMKLISMWLGGEENENHLHPQVSRYIRNSDLENLLRGDVTTEASASVFFY